MPDFEDFESWARYGYEQGFCGPPCCSTCDGVPASEDEYEYEAEHCIHVMRLYEDAATKAAL